MQTFLVAGRALLEQHICISSYRFVVQFSLWQTMRYSIISSMYVSVGEVLVSNNYFFFCLTSDVFSVKEIMSRES